LTNSVENITDSIFVEASESYNQSNPRDDPDISPRTSDSELTEEEQIIREMDRDIPSDPEYTLRRRIVNQTSSESQPSTSSLHVSECSQQNDEDKISIKLKYLNDEIKTVPAWRHETIGNFKR
jgi:hypothetical protein